jgi:hypothetical protein
MEPDRGRARRLAPSILAFAVLVAAIWLLSTRGPLVPTPRPNTAEPSAPTVAPAIPPPAFARVGFVGLPPVGAPPSSPERGQLVLSYFGPRFTHWYQVWVYEDGRLIWQREGDLREGANEYATGFLEQRLTPEGVELLRRRGTAEDALFGFPWKPPYPASWLPPRAWEDPTIRAYVPSAYAVCYQGVLRPIAAARILTWLPAPASGRLRAADFEPTTVDGWIRGFGGGCSRVATEDARTIAAALEAAGSGQDEEFQQAYALAYYLTPRGVLDDEIVVRFEPILPHGAVGCTSCGEGRRLEPG